jgi:hypothetical protein
MQSEPKDPRTTASRAKPSETPLSANDALPQDDEKGIDVCMDNELGAEWTGNIDCVEKALRKLRRGPRHR